MGFLQLTCFWQPTQVVDQNVTVDLTTKYPPKPRPTLCTTTSTTSSPVYLPMEIVLNILEAAYYDATLDPDVQLLLNCSLVCKAWSEPAQKLLFRHSSIPSQSAFASFRMAVDRSTAKGCTLSDAVARLRVILDYNQPDGLEQESFAHAVTLCPNLFELDLSVYGREEAEAAPSSADDTTGSSITDAARSTRQAPSLTASTLAALRSGPKLSALRLSNWSDNDTIAEQVLEALPGLASLTLRGRPPRVPVDANASSTTDAATVPSPYRGALKEVRMNFQTPPSLEFVSWLLHNSGESLRVLELERAPPAELLSHFVQTHGDGLESLSLPACASHGTADAVLRCGALREFKVENPWASPALFKRLPDTLEHLAFGMDKDTPLHAIMEAIKRRPAVRAVTAHLWHCEGDEAQAQAKAMLRELRAVCDARGVELLMTTNIVRFRAMVRGDPLPTRTYPRPKSLANLRAMVAHTRSRSEHALPQPGPATVEAGHAACAARSGAGAIPSALSLAGHVASDVPHAKPALAHGAPILAI